MGMNNFLYNYNYKANALLGDELEERKEWCALQFGERYINWDWEWEPVKKEDFSHIIDTFYFKSEEDLLLFLLRWG
jgi:hypothetical protein